MKISQIGQWPFFSTDEWSFLPWLKLCVLFTLLFMMTDSTCKVYVIQGISNTIHQTFFLTALPQRNVNCINISLFMLPWNLFEIQHLIADPITKSKNHIQNMGIRLAISIGKRDLIAIAQINRWQYHVIESKNGKSSVGGEW